MRLTFEIPGAPRTKKNSGIIPAKRGGRPTILPSAAFSKWNRIAQMHLMRIRSKITTPLPICTPVNASVQFYRDRDTGDAVGYFQAIADALEEGRIIDNDRLIVSWDGSRLRKDAAAPRIEVTLEVL